jgi:hypothetical protein
MKLEKTEQMKAIDRTAAAAQELIKAAVVYAETTPGSPQIQIAAQEFLEARKSAIALGVTAVEWTVQLI